MRKKISFVLTAVLAGVFLLHPFGKTALAKTVYEQEAPENPYVKVAVVTDGRTFMYDNIDDGWRKLKGTRDSVMKLYADWDIREALNIGSDYNNFTLDLNGHRIRRITNGRSKNGGVISVSRNGNITIKDLPSSQGLGKGGVITGGNNKNDGGAIYVDGGRLVMNGGTIRDCSTSDSGGAIYIKNNGSVNLTGVFLQNNSANDSGGAIYLNKGGLTVRDCAFHSNKAGDYGGAIAIDTEGAKLFDVDIQFNKAEKDGGGIWVNANRTYLSGGTIKYNMADYGGGVYVDSRYDINIQGKLIIQDNQTTSRQPSNLCLQDGLLTGARIYCGGLLHGSKVGVNKTKSLSSRGYNAVISLTEYQVRVYFTADRGKLVMKEGKAQNVIYMASALGEMNLAPFIIIFLEMIAAATVIVVAVRRRRERMKISVETEGINEEGGTES